MSASLYDSIARIARHEANAHLVAAVGRVVDVFDNQGQPDHAVSVELRDTGLVLPRVPVAVGLLGFAAIPAIDDLVMVVFLGGDVNAPVVVGRLYDDQQNPPKHTDGQIILALPSGAGDPKLDLKVEGDVPKIQLELPGDVLIELLEEKVSLKVGDLQVSLDGAGGGRVEVKAGGSTLTMKKDGDISLSSNTKLKLEATEIEISGNAKVKISGGMVEIN